MFPDDVKLCATLQPGGRGRRGSPRVDMLSLFVSGLDRNRARGLKNDMLGMLIWEGSIGKAGKRLRRVGGEGASDSNGDVGAGFIPTARRCLFLQVTNSQQSFFY